MARPNPRRPAPARAAAPVAAEPEIVEEKEKKEGSLDAWSGMVLVTTLLLVVGIVLLWKELGSHYGAGFLSDSYTPPSAG